MIELKQVWSASVSPEKEEVPASLAFNKDGSRLIVCRGRRIALYNCKDGALIKQLKGHKDKIYSVSFSYDDKRIASGGADKSTIIWSEEGKGILKFTHSDSVQVVAYNPVEDLLASCSSSDFGFWSPQEKSVVKHKVESKILCASWRNDGNVIAIGLFSGKVSLYNIYGVQIGTITRNAPIWSLSWNQHSSTEHDAALALGSWDMTLSFYDEFCQQQNLDQYLNYYPTCLSFSGCSGKYLIVGSSSGTLNLFNKEGVCLKSLDEHSSWIWSVVSSRDNQIVASVDSSGLVYCYHLIDEEARYDKWETVVVYCDCYSDVVIYDLNTDQQSRIKSNQYVKGVAIFDNQIALVVNNKILIYDVDVCTSKNIYKSSIEIDISIDLIRFTKNHVTICTKRVIKAYRTTGEIVHEWNFNSNITCIQLLCVDEEEETFMVGCQDGKVLHLLITSPFYTTILDLKRQITSISISCKGRYMGIICEKCHMFVFDQVKKVYVQNMNGPGFILFHNEIEYLCCYGSDGVVTIQDIHGFSIVENSQGVVLDFTGSSITCLLKDSSIRRININMLPLAQQKLKKYNFDSALEIAILGSTHDFLKFLAREALLNSNFTVSMKCYRKLKLQHMIEYVRRCKLKALQDCNSPKQTRALIAAEMAIIEKRFVEAGHILKKAGATKTLIEIFVKMKKFREAKESLEEKDESINYIISEEATWEEQINNWKKASYLYLKSNCYLKAVNIVGKFKGEGWIDVMCDLSEKIPDEEVEALRSCCYYLSKEDGLDDRIKSILTKIKDYSSLMQFYIKDHLWMEVANLCKLHENDIDKSLMIPYAEWLAQQGNLSEAIATFRKVDRHDRIIKLLQDLIENAILEENFYEVSLLYTTLTKEALVMRDNAKTSVTVHLVESEKLSCQYYAYAIVTQSLANNIFCVNRPSQETILNVCTYLLNSLDVSKIPRGISIVKVLYQCASIARSLGAFQTAKNAFNMIRESYIVPPNLRCELGLKFMFSETDSQEDNSDIVPICYRCGSTNLHVDKKARSCNTPPLDSCSTCFHPFIRCFVNFDVLPLIEFQPTDSVSHEEALTLITNTAGNKSQSSTLFNKSINTVLSDTKAKSYIPVKVNQNTLKSFNREEVYVIKTSPSYQPRFYKNMIPEIGIAVCQICCNFFHEEDYEYEFLKQDGCPFCRSKSDENYGHI